MSNFESLYDDTLKNLGLGGVNGGSKKPIGEITGEETTNTETEDKEGNRVVVPAGFKPVNPETTINEGIVIEDVKGNNADTCRKSVCMDTLYHKRSKQYIKI